MEWVSELRLKDIPPYKFPDPRMNGASRPIPLTAIVHAAIMLFKTTRNLRSVKIWKSVMA
jgi:hypothetical protein